MTTTGSSPTGRRAPGRSFTGLLWSLLPVLLVLVLIVWWQQRGGPQPTGTLVEPTGDVGYAQRIAPVAFPALAAAPEGWRTTSSRVDAPAGEKQSPVTLTIGYVTPGGRFAEIVVTDQTPDAVLFQIAGRATPDGTMPVGATSWDRYRSGRGETVLVRTVGRAAVLVTGDAPDTELVTLAGTVRAP